MKTTTTTTGDALVGMLIDRGVFRGVVIEITKDLTEDEVRAVIAYYDAIPEGKRNAGLLVALLREGFQPPPPPLAESDEEQKARVRRERHEKDVRWAERNGFTRAQVPFAASAKRVISMLGSEPSAASVRARLKAQYPWLFDEAVDAR